MSFKNYDDALDWLFQVRRFGSKLGLDYVRYLLEQLGNPHIHFKSIHVTGTNGKGSTTAMIASILRADGYRVGMFTSPHLISFTERIQVDGVQISPSDVMRLIEEMKPFIDDMDKNPDLRHPTFFEIITAMAFSYFAECSVDFAVLEVGMGGELDATNVVHALVSVVTNVSLEHTEVLGDTVLEIAEKKGGIIKSGGVLITATEDDSVYSLLSQMCRDRMSKIFRVGSDVKYEAIRSTIDGQSFNNV